MLLYQLLSLQYTYDVPKQQFQEENYSSRFRECHDNDDGDYDDDDKDDGDDKDGGDGDDDVNDDDDDDCIGPVGLLPECLAFKRRDGTRRRK